MTAKTRKYPIIKYVTHRLLPDPYPCPRIVTQERFEDALSYEAKPGDIFICTYPKCGTTWVETVLEIMRREGRPFEPGECVEDEVPFLDFVGRGAVESVERRPRILKTHYYQELVPWSDEAKYIVVARNPKDCFTSFYHHTVGFENIFDFKDGKFEDYFEKAIVGDVDYGDYFKYTSGWWEKSKEKSNVLFVLYEDMKEDAKREFTTIVDFIGMGWPQKVKANNGELLKKMVEGSSFDKMKKSKHVVKANEEFLYRPSHKPFIRKGVIGDWKTIFNEEQSRRIDERMKETGRIHPGFDHIWDKYSELLTF